VKKKSHGNTHGSFQVAIAREMHLKLKMKQKVGVMRNGL